MNEHYNLGIWKFTGSHPHVKARRQVNFPKNDSDLFILQKMDYIRNQIKDQIVALKLLWANKRQVRKLSIYYEKYGIIFIPILSSSTFRLVVFSPR